MRNGFCNNSRNCLSIVVFCIAIVASLIIWLTNSNHFLFHYLNSLHFIMPDVIWNWCNYIAYPKYAVLPIILLATTVVFRRDKTFAIVRAIILFYLIFWLLKHLVHEARPYALLPANSLFFLSGFENAHKVAFHSFPSGHGGMAALFVFALIALYKPQNIFVNAVLMLLLCLVSLARICSGWHWPLDITLSIPLAYLVLKASGSFRS